MTLFFLLILALLCPKLITGLPWWLSGKKIFLSIQETWVRSLDQDDPPEEEMATHSSVLPWEMLWTEEPGRL